MIIINYIYLVYLLVPSHLRGEHLITFLNACIAPVDRLHDVFQQFYQATKWSLTWNGQVCMLEELLNQQFNPSELPFRIYITDGGTLENTYIFKVDETIAENEETYVWSIDDNSGTTPLYNDVWLYTVNEFTESFIIHVPVDLLFPLEQFEALINKYKLPTKKYKIVYE